MRPLRALLPSADRFAAVRGLRCLEPVAARRELWRLGALGRAARWSSIRNAKGEAS